jgi:hypothetical protein
MHRKTAAMMTLCIGILSAGNWNAASQEHHRSNQPGKTIPLLYRA